ncbi:MAG: hypothetical protein KKF98_08290 [Bacteroidetes bacterium]|nr:hypothetical protein [Bacteroidota bacterium]
MRWNIFLAVFWLISVSSEVVGQPLQDRLEVLKQQYPFSYTKLETNYAFSEKYLISFTQSLDYQGSVTDTFTQRVVISHRDFSSPVVFITEGYDAHSTLKKDFEYELTRYLNANQVCVEHRYFGESKPDSMVWKNLTTENAATDHHRIAMFVKEILYI